MGKTPDEVKKGLACGSKNAVTRDCNACPYTVDRILWNCQFVCMRDALAYIQQLEAQVPRWIPVEERLPEHNVFVIVGYKRYGYAFEGCYSEEESEWYDREYSSIANPSHWMPMPEPPKEE